MLFGFLISNTLPAQDLPIGAWRTHHSYNNGRILTASPTKVFCAVANGLFSLDRSDNSLSKITKISGLSDAQISAMQYDDTETLLVIGYTSGLIDLVYESKIFTIRDYKELNRDVNKTIYDVAVHNGLVYAATEIGVLVVSLKERAILDNFSAIGADAADLSVFDLLEADEKLYIITNEGIQVGDLTKNLLDFNNWTRYRLDVNHTFSKLNSANGIYFIHNENEVAKLVGDTLETVATFPSKIKSLRSSDEELNVLLDNELYSISNGTSSLLKAFANISDANDVVAGGMWVADGKMGLVDQAEKSWMPNGPISDKITHLKMDVGKLFAFYGPKAQNYDGTFDDLGYSAFSSATWEYQEVQNFSNLTDVATYRGKRYFSSAGAGLFVEEENLILNTSNSIFTENVGSTGVHISALTAGRSLWVASYNNNTPLLELNRDSEWKAYSASNIGTSLPLSVQISDLGVLWIPRSEGNVSVWDSFDNALTTVNLVRGLPSPSVNGLSISVKDEAWIATEKGIANFADASYIASDEVAFPLLFENEDVYKDLPVTAIATDGGGRIWVAGLGHLAVYNAQLTKRELFFTAEKSPLPSNDILEMEYNPENGEMFILTTKGLVSYRSNSSVAPDFHQNVKIFPNPVRPGYTGLVGISGLAADADIKITDVNGKLIQNVKARGGTASWNLRDYNNTKVKSGIYLILSATEDGEETHIGKIAIVN